MADKAPKAEKVSELIKSPIPDVPCWIYPAILPKGGTMIFGSDSKTGKSFCALSLALALSTGKKPFDCPYFTAEQCRVLLVEREIGKAGLKARVKKIFYNEKQEDYEENLWYVSKEPNLQLDDKTGQENLMELLDTVKPNVLILDPIGKMHSYPENANEKIGELFLFLDSLKYRFRHNDMSIIMSHHFKKAAKDPKFEIDPLDHNNFRGASKFVNDPDTLVMMQRLPDLNLPWKSWRLKVRWITRQGEEPDEMFLLFNEKNDLRVRWERNLGPLPKLPQPGLPKHPKQDFIWPEEQ
jgi:RecA-family ATPase